MQGKSDGRTVSSEQTQEQLENIMRSLREAGQILRVV